MPANGKALVSVPHTQHIHFLTHTHTDLDGELDDGLALVHHLLLVHLVVLNDGLRLPSQHRQRGLVRERGREHIVLGRALLGLEVRLLLRLQPERGNGREFLLRGRGAEMCVCGCLFVCVCARARVCVP